MKKSLIITRSDAWIAEQRLATGENTPDEVKVEFDIADLSIESRRILLETGHGSYPANERLHYGSDLRLNTHASYGRLKIVVDEVAPTAAQIDAAIRKAADELNARREQEEIERKADAEREAAEKKAKEDARELLKDELDRKESRIKYLEGELAEAREKIEEMESETV